MTSDEFASKYDVHQQITEGPVRSHFALHRSAKVVALVHYLEGGETRENAARLAQVQALADSGRHVVLEVCNVDGTPVVVTRFILNFATFDAWLAAESAAPPTQAPAPAAGHTAAPDTAAERHPAAPAPTQALPILRTERVAPPPAAAAPPPPPAAAETAPSASAAPGDFTRLFRSPWSAPASPPGAPATPPPAPQEGGGELTRGPGAAASLEPPPAPPPSPGPARTAPRRGSFTGLFGKLEVPQAAPPPPAEPQGGADELYRRLHGTPEPPSPPTPPSPPPSPPPARPGEFTQVFGAAATTPAAPARPPSAGLGPPAVPQAWPPEPRAAPSPQGGADYVARLQGTRPAVPPAPSPATPTAPARTIASEFTRALRRISASALPPAEPEERSAEASPGPRPSALPWVIAIVGLLVVVAAGIVLYFALMSK
jgi:hypothetical protein